MSRVSSFYTLFTHLEKAADGTSIYCLDCPIAGTEHCHKVNPTAPKYTRYEKIRIREEMDKDQTTYKEAK